jgi:DNA processing protein
MTQLKEWLVLIRTPALGASRLRSLLQEFGDPKGVIGASPVALRERGLSSASIEAIKNPNQALIDQDLRWLEADQHHLITLNDQDYPPQLREIPTPPAALFVLGNPDVLWMPQLAIVGSRKPTRGGLANARSFGHALAASGLTITSGLARGIDGAAHQAALDGGGRSIAVAATGLDRVYPASHRQLARQIAENGAIVSEFPVGTEPLKQHFPSRNRIISGLSLATLVVEAGIKSGSLITAHLALNQARDVFAIPGSVRNPMARGCHQLIQQGAGLVETPEDLINELAPRACAQAGELRLELIATPTTNEPGNIEAAPNDPNVAKDDEYQRLLQAMGYDPITTDALVDETGLTADVVSSMLLILELSGLIEAGPGGSYCRTGEECR